MTGGEKLEDNISTFLRHLDSIRDTLPMAILLIEPYNKKATDKFMEFLDNNVSEIEDENGEKRFSIKPEEVKIFETLEKNSSISSLAYKIIPESLFVSLLSQYDAFLNRLLRIIFEIKPEILNNSERNLSFSQLVEMGSLNDAREYIVEKEIETVLRKSHTEHFEYLETKIGIKLRTNLSSWKNFIEVTERRNLLVHCDGIVSNQYLKVCKENNYDVGKIKVGERLEIDIEYFNKSYECLYEIAVKLTHTLWRKMLKDDLENADKELNEICFNLINSNSFVLADNLLVFGCEQKKHFDESLRIVFIVNAALSKYLQNKKEDARKILESKDWSATSDDFKLAFNVLTDKFDEAFQIMKKIGKTGEVEKNHYREWPLFRIIRKQSQFKATYKEIFGEEYKVLEIPMRPIQELLNKKSTDKNLTKKITKRPVKKK